MPCRPSCPGPEVGERVRPPDSAPYLDPSFQNTAPPSQPAQHDEDTRSHVYFGHFIPFGHFVLLFLFNKSLSEAWRHTHCVCRLLRPPQYISRSVKTLLLCIFAVCVTKLRRAVRFTLEFTVRQIQLHGASIQMNWKIKW